MSESIRAQLRRLLPEPAADLDPGDVGGLADHYQHTAGVTRLDMVSSLDGAASVQGTSRGLHTPLDQLVFGLLRALSDVVLVGAGTARGEGYRPAKVRADFAGLRVGRPAAATIAVLTRGADLDPSSELVAGAPADRRTVVITCEASDAGRRRALSSAGADVVVAGDSSVDLAAGIAALAERGLLRVLCEGGPSLAADLVANGLLDELCLTLSPLLSGAEAPRILSGPDGQQPVPVRPTALLLDPNDGTLAGRWAVGAGSLP